MYGKFIKYQQCNFSDGQASIFTSFFESYVLLEKCVRNLFSGLLCPLLSIFLTQGRSHRAHGNNWNQSLQTSY